MKTLTNKPYKQIWEAIAEGIKEAIVNGTFRGGDRLIENDLAIKYASSKTPVKEALRYLEGIGFVEITPYRGANVRKMDKGDVLSLYRIQSALEGLAALEARPHLKASHYEKMEKCAQLVEDYYRQKQFTKYDRMNLIFHSIPWEVIDNRRLIDLINHIREHLQRYRPVIRRYPDRFEEIVRDHRRIIEGFMQEDPDRTEKVIRDHFQKAGALIVELLERDNSF